MSIDEIASQALSLPARERALLATSLWESLDNASESLEANDEAAVIALALQRDGEIESGQVKAVSHSELMTNLRR